MNFGTGTITKIASQNNYINNSVPKLRTKKAFNCGMPIVQLTLYIVIASSKDSTGIRRIHHGNI
jgi:hypothetical protein